MNENSVVSNALKVDIRAAGDGPLVWLINKIVTLKQWCRPVRWMLGLLPAWITPNGVTVFRGLLALPAAGLIVMHRNWWALAVLLASLALDFVDGALAELRNQRTALGTVLDPIADKFTVVLVCATLLACRPTTYAVMVLSLMIGIELGIQVLRSRRMIAWQPKAGGSTSRAQHVAAKWPGKMKVVCESLALAVLTVAPLFPAALWPIGSLLLLPAIAFGLCSLASQLGR